MAGETTTQAPETKPWKRETRDLMCQLTEPELVAKGEALAAAMEKQKALESDLKDLREQIAGVKWTITRLHTDILYKQELRLIECELHPDFEHGSVDVYRTDTGAFVTRREMEGGERQLKLFPDEDGDAAGDAPQGEEAGDDAPAADGGPVCICGHSRMDHNQDEGACADCTCEMFEASEDVPAGAEVDLAELCACGHRRGMHLYGSHDNALGSGKCFERRCKCRAFELPAAAPQGTLPLDGDQGKEPPQAPADGASKSAQDLADEILPKLESGHIKTVMDVVVVTGVTYDLAAKVFDLAMEMKHHNQAPAGADDAKEAATIRRDARNLAKLCRAGIPVVRMPANGDGRVYHRYDYHGDTAEGGVWRPVTHKTKKACAEAFRQECDVSANLGHIVSCFGGKFTLMRLRGGETDAKIWLKTAERDWFKESETRQSSDRVAELRADPTVLEA